ncbi:hypothetical protein [Vibrio phage PhiImVa-1]|nr:hypothetical protein [Vibrio phage PhiImVa-1]
MARSNMLHLSTSGTLGGDAYAHMISMNKIARINNAKPTVVTVRKATKKPRPILN